MFSRFLADFSQFPSEFFDKLRMDNSHLIYPKVRILPLKTENRPLGDQAFHQKTPRQTLSDTRGAGWDVY